MDEEENDDVLDFSSGSAKAVKNTATKVKVVSEKETKNAGGKAFSQFRYDHHCPKYTMSFHFMTVSKSYGNGGYFETRSIPGATGKSANISPPFWLLILRTHYGK